MRRTLEDTNLHDEKEDERNDRKQRVPQSRLPGRLAEIEICHRTQAITEFKNEPSDSSDNV